MHRDDETTRPGARVADLTWAEVEQRIQSRPLGVLPVGAQAKEHGLHLPMNTDWLQAQWIADRMRALYNVLIWPTLNYGYYPAFTDFPGSCTIGENTFELLGVDICSGIFGHGIVDLVILNTGISTIPALDRVSRRTGAKLINVYAGAELGQLTYALCTQERGGHADEIETSIMLAIDSSSVKMTRATACLSRTLGPGALVRDDPAHPNYTPSGVYGDPTLASAEKGRRLVAAIMADIDSMLRDLGRGRG